MPRFRSASRSKPVCSGKPVVPAVVCSRRSCASIARVETTPIRHHWTAPTTRRPGSIWPAARLERTSRTFNVVLLGLERDPSGVNRSWDFLSRRNVIQAVCRVEAGGHVDTALARSPGPCSGRGNVWAEPSSGRRAVRGQRGERQPLAGVRTRSGRRAPETDGRRPALARGRDAWRDDPGALRGGAGHHAPGASGGSRRARRRGRLRRPVALLRPAWDHCEKRRRTPPSRTGRTS